MLKLKEKNKCDDVDNEENVKKFSSERTTDNQQTE